MTRGHVRDSNDSPGRNRAVIGFRSHPAGLASLFLTELWERFSFYGLQALLILYLVSSPADGGLGYGVAHAATVYGNYTMFVYLLSALGGYLADRWLGAARTVLIGGMTIVAGHLLLAVGPSGSLYAGLACVASGTGLLKPNVTALVGRLYARDDPRRDSGFSLYYMGINIGALVSPLVCGYLAQGDGFREWLVASGFDARRSWHWGFGAAGAGMLLGLLVFLTSWQKWRRLEADDPFHHPGNAVSVANAPVRRAAAIAFFCACAIVFFAMSKQAGSSLNLFADRYTRSELFGWEFPSSWFQSVSALWVILLAPVFSTLWLRLGPRQPSSPAKAVIGLAAAGASLLIMMFAAQASVLGPVSPAWLLSVYLVQTIGEMCVSPIGLSNVTRLAAARRIGLMMGLWFVAIAIGAKLASLSAAWMGAGRDLPLIFGQQALLAAIACALLTLLIRPVLKLIRELERT